MTQLIATPQTQPEGDGADQPGGEEETPRGREFVSSLERGLKVMQALGDAPEGLTLTDVAGRIGLTRATARRFLLTLVELGYVRQERRLFLLTPKVLSLGVTYLSNRPIWQTAEPVMRELSRRVNESCSAAVLDGTEVVYVARVAGKRIMSVNITIGTRLPALVTSMGRVLLSNLSPTALHAFLAKAEIERFTQYTVTDRDALAAEINKVRTRGYAIVDQELEVGLRSIAVPLRDRAGRAFAGLNISTQTARVSSETLVTDFLPLMREAARRIGDFYGTQPQASLS
ncbi:IclR family transcriptional regulator [Breoghania corrubedonensis]|uniref:IclR family transcriptional regulator n=1 Tax=Breoghania corrubedonensis TaxID=665038 RepID=A0A2T5VFR9_9HYPH|nr:IclR family transcriptional regulator C-terminal domain-containing protein [Breoghania corrubedonensis]PTW62602.1 IclR family transcriptional regulator [Breoghania corrubedonensis]